MPDTQLERSITIYHSPDSDDAFMFYGLSSGAVRVPGYDFKHELCDIETLNQRTVRGELEVTAVSVHAFPYLNGKYAILNAGASMGGVDYGPRIVACAPIGLQDLAGKRIAIPGALTSATLALRLLLAEHKLDAELVNYPFNEVQQAVQSGAVDAGVLIHEGQLTTARDGLQIIQDLGEWWWNKHKLPLPLGVNVVKQSLGEPAIEAVSEALYRSIRFGLDNREKALAYALQFGRGLSSDEADSFVGMYVNERTLNLGEDGRRSIALFLQAGAELGIIPEIEAAEFY